MKTKLNEYLQSEDFVGLDNVLILQRKVDGAIATKLGITSLAPLGFIVGLAVGYIFFT